MKALILHANHWASIPDKPSERIGTAAPDPCPAPETLIMTECLVVFFQVEEHDGEKQARLLCKDILKIAAKVGTTRLVVECFAHLSHSRPEPTIAKNLVSQVLETCKGFEGHEVRTSPFGWDKGLVLNIKSHPDAFKHRSY